MRVNTIKMAALISAWVGRFNNCYGFCSMREFLVLVLLLALNSSVTAEEVLLSPEQFLARAFGENVEPATMQTLWLNNEIKETAKQKMGYQFNQLRLRYWGAEERTAWLLEEVGKERPITIGVVVEKNQIRDVAILVYRESRGGEVRHEFFTNQFKGATLIKNGNNYHLSEDIDGISGATLSVRAVKKVATLALFLHGLTPFSNGEK